MYNDKKGKWIVEKGVKYLVEESEDRKKERKKNALKEKKEKETKNKQKELRKLGYQLIEELPNIFAEFFPIIKAMLKASNVELTKEQEDLVQKYIEKKKELKK